MSLSAINPFATKKFTLPPTVKTRDQIEVGIGSSNSAIDGIRNILSIPMKIVLLNNNVNSGNISQETIEKMKGYLHENGLHDVYVSVNEYNPVKLCQRTFSNPNTSLLSKCTTGISNILLETFTIPKLTGFPGDHYNPMSNSVHLFSNDSSIAIHECGHAKDFNSRENPTLYVVMANLPVVGPFVTLFHEAKATENAFLYLKKKGNTAGLQDACKVLIPAYSTYAGYAAMQCGLNPWVSFLLFLGLGHLIGHFAAEQIRKETPAGTDKIATEQGSPTNQKLSTSQIKYPRSPIPQQSGAAAPAA